VGGIIRPRQREEVTVSEFVTYARSGGIAQIAMDDGKVNAMSPRMLAALHAAFDRAQADGVVTVLRGRTGCFSAGFDLKVFQSGDAEASRAMLRAGAELALRLLAFPTPVLCACTGHAYPMGAFLLMSSDLRIGADGPFRIGLNEVTIGLTIPKFALEIARYRLTPAHFNRTATTGEMFGPAEAVAAGFLDRVTADVELDAAVEEAATRLTKLNMPAHHATKLRVRAPAIAAVRAAIDEELGSGR
jgi:enoyl-CoA hydratase